MYIYRYIHTEIHIFVNTHTLHRCLLALKVNNFVAERILTKYFFPNRFYSINGSFVSAVLCLIPVTAACFRCLHRVRLSIRCLIVAVSPSSPPVQTHTAPLLFTPCEVASVQWAHHLRVASAPPHPSKSWSLQPLWPVPLPHHVQPCKSERLQFQHS